MSSAHLSLRYPDDIRRHICVVAVSPRVSYGDLVVYYEVREKKMTKTKAKVTKAVKARTSGFRQFIAASREIRPPGLNGAGRTI